jgi:integrase
LTLVLRHSGARVGEVARLTTAMVDTRGEVWRATLDRHKTSHAGHERVILLGPAAIEVIRPWLMPDAPDLPIFGPRRVDARTAVRGGDRAPGRQYARPSLPQAIRRAVAKAGVEPWTLAQLRHSRATLLREQFGIDVAAVVLGHSRPSTTFHYSRAAVAHAIDAVRQAG